MAKKKRRQKPSDARLYGGIAALALLLGALVIWSLPGDRRPPPPEAEADAAPLSPLPERERATAVPRPPGASAELAIVTDLPEDALRKLATPGEIARRLDRRHCGDACDAVRKFMTDEDAFDVLFMTTDDLILPPKDTLETVASGLTPAERDSLSRKVHAAVVRTTGPLTREQLPARAAFAAAAVLAEATNGFVYDEAARRIETASELGSHTVTAKLGAPAFLPRHIVVQLYRQEEGTARVLTLGMARFGSPDLSMRGANMSSGPLLAEILDAAASRIAHGHDQPTLTITLDDVAAIRGKKAAEINTGEARPVTFDIVEPARQEGDPDNDLAELVPPGGSTRESWDAVIGSLFGLAPATSAAIDDKELAEVTKRARRDLSTAIRRFQSGEGDLFVKGPFAIPEDERADGGPSVEHLWLAVVSCDARACSGSLSNEPTYLTNLAAGKTTTVQRAEVVDFLLQQRDGGTSGGDSIKILKARR